MAIDPKENTQEPAHETLSFGGVVPHLPDGPGGDLSIVDEAPGEEKLDISGTNENRPPLNEDARKERTDKIHFSLGDDSPGKEVVDQKLLTGQEDDLRAQAASRADLKDKELQVQLVKEKASQGPLEGHPERVRELEGLVRLKPANNPDTIFEKYFADKYVPIASGLKDGENVIAKGQVQNPAQAATAEDVARKMVEKQEIAKFAHEDQKTRYENQSFAGKAGDFAKNFVPGYAWYKTYNAVTGTPSDSVLEGSNWADQIHYLYTLPAAEMHQKLRETLNKLNEDNPALALEFSEAAVHYTKTDAFIHNVGNVIDVATTLPGATVAGVKTLKALAGIPVTRAAKKEVENQLVQALKDHVAVNAQPGVTLANTLSAMGDLDKAAVTAVTEKAKEILLSKGQATLTRKEIRDLLPSIFNPEAYLAEGSNLSAKQTIELMTHLTYNASTVLERVNNLAKVGRLPEEALQVAIQEAKDSLKDRFRHVNDTVVDVIHNGVEHTGPFEKVGDTHGMHRVLADFDNVVDVNGTHLESLLQGQTVTKGTTSWHKDVQDVVDRLSKDLNLSYSPRVWVGKDKGGNNGMAYGNGHIVLRDDMNAKQAIGVALHELGHHAEWSLLDKADQATRDAIKAAFQEHLSKFKKGKITYSQISPLTSTNNTPAHDAYVDWGRNFAEWWAEQTSRWISQTKEPGNAVEKFFQTIGQVWRRLYERAFGHVPLHREVDAFFRKNWKGDQLAERIFKEPEYLVTRPEESDANVGSVTALFGDREGNSFESDQHAYNWAKAIYGLHENDITIHQRGVGFYIGVTKNLDETSPGVRQALITTKNQTPKQANSLVGWLLGDGRLSPFQNENRITAVSGQQGLVSALKDMQTDLTSLSRKERSALKKVMESNRTAIKDPQTGETGVFHRTFADFSKDFELLNGRAPSPKETRAYFTAVQINDFEYLLRNNSLYKELSRLGLETFFLKTKEMKNGLPYFGQTKKFLGKYIDDLPLSTTDSTHPARVAIYHEGENPEIVPLSHMDSAERKAWLKERKAEGYRIIQTGVPNRKPGAEVFGEDPVNFIITKDHESHILDRIQLPYREGWHQEYQHSWYIKQANIRRIAQEGGGDLHHVYEGDTTAMGFHTKTEAQKFEKAFNEARKMVLNNKPGLAQFLEKNLPYSEKQFRNLFEGKTNPATGEIEAAKFNLNDEFHVVSSGNSVMDAHGEKLRSQYPNFNDTIRSPWNLYDQVDKKFVGQRDPLLHTVKESGTEENPVFQLATAETIDPMASLSRAMTNMVRNQYMLDYRTQAVESWIQEFGDLLAGDLSAQELANNALHHLYTGELKTRTLENAERWNAAQASRRAIKEFLGNSMTSANSVDLAKQKILETVYKNFGQEWSNFLAPKILAAELDPLKAMRGFAFHTTIGLFNPIQLWQNAQTAGSAIAIAGPTHGWAGLKAGMMFQYLRLNQTDAVVKHLAKVSGWKEEHFKEAWKTFLDSGRFHVEGEHAWKDDVADPKFFQGKLGAFLDKGTIFFREGERGSRMVAHAAAYSEWRAANPQAQLTAEAARGIAKRADDLTFNMTRASMASWQQGLFSVPTQFLSYNARIMESFLGNKLSNAEKARLFIWNSALYGVPVGLALPVAGVYNPYEDVRAMALEKGWNVEDKAFQAFNDGLMGLAVSSITGRASDIGQKSGPGGTSLFRDVLKGDKGFFEALLGASGTKAGDALTVAQPAFRWLVSAATATPEKNPMFASDAIDMLRTVSSFDSATKLYLAMKTGMLMTKSGMQFGVTTPEAVLNAVTGASPRKISDEQMMLALGRDRANAIKQIEKEIVKQHVEAIKAMDNGDEETYNARMKRIEALYMIGDMRDDEKASVMSKVYDQLGDNGDKIRFDWVFKNAPASEIEQRHNEWNKQ